MDAPLGGDGASGGDERLPGHLAAEDALKADLGPRPAVQAGVDLFEVEDAEERVHGVLADEYLAHYEPIWWTRTVLVEPGVPAGVPATMTTRSPGAASPCSCMVLSTSWNMASVWSTCSTR